MPYDTTAYITVAMPVPLPQMFEYSIAHKDIHHYHVGNRVAVPFGKKAIVGIVMDVSESTNFDPEKIKPAHILLDEEPIFTPSQIALARWIASFYLYPLGEVFVAMLPKLLRNCRKTSEQASTHEGELLTSYDFTSSEPPKLEFLLASNANNANEETVASLSRSKKQAELYAALCDKPIELLNVKKDFSPSIIKGLIEKSLAEIKTQAPAQNTWPADLMLGEKKRANPEQAIAIASINQANQYTTFLLEGVTGSGKTEVYLQVIEKTLSQGKQVLILVPEIGLTPQTVKRFEQRFGNIVSVWHSALTDHERLKVWLQAKYNQVGIIIGTRSAVFLPLAQPGMIIVDEEHDESFKQQDGLRYHARDIAAYRAKQEEISLILGSATPSLESLHNALGKKYHHLQLTMRAGNASMPALRLIDLTGLPLEAGIAPSLLTRIEQQLKQGNQVLVYVNRRGYAPALICQQCGHVETCNDCDTPYTLHLSSQNLQCHRCGQFHTYIHKCRQCHSSNITTQGIGTEQIQRFLSQRFSAYSCVRIDSDSTRGKRKLNTLLSEINQNKHQLLVGTQILSKGHHFPNVTLALILNVDSFLFSSDFRAPEKLAQLVTQFSGRAGRANKSGEVWLQSYQVGHPLLQDLVNNGYAHFSRLLLQERIAAKLPPAQWQVAIRVAHADKEIIMTFMQYANQLLGQFQQLHYIGPFPAGVEKKQMRYRFITVAQSHSYQYLNKALAQVKEALSKHKLAPKLRWAIDVMPTDFS